MGQEWRVRPGQRQKTKSAVADTVKRVLGGAWRKAGFGCMVRS